MFKKKSKTSGGGSSSSSALFPLPEGFFPKVALTELQTARYERHMQQIVRDALDAYERHEDMGDLPAYCEPWRWMSSVENLIAVQQSSNSKAGHTTKSRIFGRINGDFRQQMDFYYAETAKDLFEWHQVMYGNTVDAAVLCNIHTVSEAGAASSPHLYMGIKWLCVSAPRILTRKRDHLFLEYMTFTTDLRGREVGIRVTLPIEIPECPDLAQQLHVKRVKTHSVMILRAAANDRNATEFFQMTETDSAVNYVNAAHYKREMIMIKDMALFVDARRISHRSLRARDEWVPRAERSACAICQRGFGTTRRHHHCRLCGEVICGSCAIVRKARRRGKSVKTKVCLQCVTAIRESESASSIDFSTSSQSFTLSAAGDDFYKSKSGSSRRTREGGASTCDSEMDDDDTAAASDWESESEGGDGDGGWSSSMRSSSMRSSRSLLEEVDMDGSDTRLSASSTVSLSESSSTHEKHSFMTTLDVIEDQSEEPELVDFSKDLECLLEGGAIEVIDTKDMTPVQPKQQPASPARMGSPDAATHIVPRSMRFHATQLSSNNASSSSIHAAEPLRSLDQCLAEQEELLKMMVLVASGSASASSSANSSRHNSIV